VAVAYLLTKHWLLNNAIGLCLAVTGVEFLGLPPRGVPSVAWAYVDMSLGAIPGTPRAPSFKVGAIMLVCRWDARPLATG